MSINPMSSPRLSVISEGERFSQDLTRLSELTAKEEAGTLSHTEAQVLEAFRAFPNNPNARHFFLMELRGEKLTDVQAASYQAHREYHNSYPELIDFRIEELLGRLTPEKQEKYDLLKSSVYAARAAGGSPPRALSGSANEMSTDAVRWDVPGFEAFSGQASSTAKAAEKTGEVKAGQTTANHPSSFLSWLSSNKK